jgi:DNA-binding PadR family transcriptional regulator
MYELIILGFLMRKPTHGYIIAKIINDMIGPYAKFSSGRLYPLLTKLEADGLIVASEASPEGGDRRQHPYAITEAGRHRFHALMLDTSSNPGDYQRIFWHKLPHLHTLTASERLYLFDHYLNFCQTHIFHLTGEMEELEREALARGYMNAKELDVTLRAMRHARDQWRLELENAKDWRAREDAALAGAM